MTLDFLKQFLLLFNYAFIYLAVLGLCCCPSFSLVVESGGYSLDMVCGLLTVVASLVVEHEL